MLVPASVSRLFDKEVPLFLYYSAFVMRSYGANGHANGFGLELHFFLMPFFDISV
jgi:hypothetical protein